MRRSKKGFALYEVLLGLAIFALGVLALGRAVQNCLNASTLNAEEDRVRQILSNLMAIRLSSEALAVDARYDGLREVLAAQWQSLPPGKGALLGEAFKLNDRERDEIRWICSAGPGLMTRYAAADFVVALRLQSEKKDGDRLDLGFLRKPKDDSSLTNANESWVPLIENVRSFQVRYFDARLNVWVERWTDAGTLPRLVKLTVGRTDARVPWEAIIPLGRTPM